MEDANTPLAGFARGDIARRGEEWLDRLPPEFVARHLGETIVIDVRTGEHCLGRNPMTAVRELRKRVPDPACYFAKVGYAAWAHIGAAPRRRA